MQSAEQITQAAGWEQHPRGAEVLRSREGTYPAGVPSPRPPGQGKTTKLDLTPAQPRRAAIKAFSAAPRGAAGGEGGTVTACRASQQQRAA